LHVDITAQAEKTSSDRSGNIGKREAEEIGTAPRAQIEEESTHSMLNDAQQLASRL